MCQEWRYLATAHLIYLVLFVIALIALPDFDKGPLFLILVLFYDLLILSFAQLHDNPKIMDIWVFSAIFSVFQVFPDWYLSQGLNVLVFPDDGIFKIGTVSGYMLGLWTIPIFIILYISTEASQHNTEGFGYLIALLSGLTIFGASELISHQAGSWYAQNVTMFHDIALYIIPAEIMLSVASRYLYTQISEKNLWYKVLGAVILMIFYLGCAVTSYFIIEILLST